MLNKKLAINILNAANRILLDEEDMEDMRILLQKSSEQEVQISYQRYINEIIKQCGKH